LTACSRAATSPGALVRQKIFRTSEAAGAVILGLQRRRKYAAFPQDLTTDSENFTITERLAAQTDGNMFEKKATNSRVQRLGAPHDLSQLPVSQRERRLIAAGLIR
jgi:hypothetical protein